jgi:cytoskeletal protein CcmA (bactofilin family)
MPQPANTAVPPDLTLIGRADRLEGTLKVAGTLRIQGTVEGSVEATTVHIDEGAKVRADITADEVVIGGDYSGKLVCRQRLEIRATGQVVGHVETFRLMLHEGGSIDGELKMLKQPAPAEADANRANSARSARDPGPRSTVSALNASGSGEAGADAANGQAASVAAAGAEPIG